ncbi:hypothetical protein B0J11DRAFT_592832 [Dendryphion nanum]|uniref:SMP-30/Gluconolactonase/LRE-like region domain-containing protein n=1 Tax=Dendryphion nanum TaxID=256645 RepID=A0A9P9DCN6_9PLEO|nr:hypothetical protein B0J11DRAFT_592832 [Dendryphion nanum]
MRLSCLFTILASATAVVSAVPLDKRQSTTQVYKFSGSPSSAEGIAARSNGQLLVSFFDKGELWTVDPATKKASKVASFTDATCTGAITEIAPDVFAVVAGQFSFGGGNKPGSWAIWKVDFTKATPVASVLKKIPESTFFNGLTTLNNDTILIGDAGKGAIWRLNVNTGAYSIAIQDTTMAPPSGQPMGLDGLRYVNGTIYFTNVFKNTFHKVAVDATGKATGSIATIWSGTMADDLWVTPDGTSYVATGSANKIQKVTSDNKISTIASISGSTAVTFGRTEADKNTLYITTGSGVIASIKV